MLNANENGIRALRSVLEEINYLFVIKALRELGSFQDPWYDFATMKRALEEINSPYQNTFLLLQMGLDAPRTALEAEIGAERVEAILDTGLWEECSNVIRCRNLVVLTYQGLYLVTELNPWFENCRNRNTDVYIGIDSLHLAENISFRKGAAVLDLCSGTGIQGLLAAKSAAKVVSVELNPKAVPVTRFNVLLNRAEDIMEVREGNLYEVLHNDETFDCIYANPPFIPMLDDVEYPMCGGGGEDGLQVLRGILEGLPQRLRAGGEAVIFCECLGNEKGVFFDSEVEKVAKEQGWRCTVAHKERIEAGYQIERLADLTALFQEPFDKEDFKRRMHELYSRLGAKYLYGILYRIENNGRADFISINTYNPWHIEDKASAAEELHTENHAGMTCLCLNNRTVRTVGPDVLELIELLKEGQSVERAAKWLYFRYKRTLLGPKISYNAYLTTILTTCRLLERDGILKRLPKT